MNNILIVDDEYLSRNKLRYIIDYRSFGFNIIGEATNGKEAIDFISSNPVDVVFTDVAMPEIDGIMLSKYIREHFPRIKVVIMSNYSDFDYIKQAFSANVSDYFLKHELTRDKMQGLLNSLQSQIKTSDNVSSFEESIRNEELHRSRIIHALSGSSSDFVCPNSLVLLIQIDSKRLCTPIYTKEEIDIIYQNISNLIAQAVGSINDYVIFRNDDVIVSYLSFDESMSEIKIMHEINQYIRSITYSIYKLFKFNTLLSISRLSDTNYPLHQCYEEAVQMLHSSPFAGKTASGQDSVLIDSQIYNLPIKQEKQLLNALSGLSTVHICQCLDEIFSAIDDGTPTNILIGDLISIATKFCSDTGISFPDMPIPNLNLPLNLQLDWCKNMFTTIINTCMSAESGQLHSEYTQSVIKYIEKNYSNNILLKDIAKHIGISEQYLSTVFKKDLGKSPSDYLTEFRIEQAKELLEQNKLNLKEIYSQVGFNSYNYFFTVFKKLTGLTPNAYKKGKRKTCH